MQVWLMDCEVQSSSVGVVLPIRQTQTIGQEQRLFPPQTWSRDVAKRLESVFFRRNVQPEAADAVAVVLQRLLAPLAQGNQQTLQEVFSKPNDAAVWLKTIATTLEALTVHLPRSSQQMSGSACRKSPVSTVVSMWCPTNPTDLRSADGLGR